MPVPSATRLAVRYRIMDLDDMNPLLIDATTLDSAINSALTRYSTDRARELTADITGTGSEFYPLTGVGAVLTGWSDGVSQILAIDYPAKPVTAGYSPTWLNSAYDWSFYRDASNIEYLRFLTVTPSATEKVRATYTAPHVHTTASNTVPAGDFDALCDLAASYACQALATKMAASQDSLIAADSTNYRDGQIRFSQQAKNWEASYNARMGIAMNADGTASVAAASAVADWNRTATTGGPFLTHRRRWG